MGATGVNGETTRDYTEFYETVPSNRLERLLWMESNRFARVLSNLTAQNVAGSAKSSSMRSAKTPIMFRTAGSTERCSRIFSHQATRIGTALKGKRKIFERQRYKTRAHSTPPFTRLTG